ncbi:MAG TPA: class E sortase [Candidatus Saccharimonadia bacterium]|nr:class E sortase [Candidatus Saccharimonadia bacterium]
MLILLRHQIIRLGLAAVFMAGGLYLAYLLLMAPHRAALPADGRLTAGAPLPDRQLVIPRLGVQVNIVADQLAQLDHGLVVQRTGAGGNPAKGGNFVLVGHRYVFSWVPARVSLVSVFYDLDKLKTGDAITVYWQHKRYHYTVSRTYQVKPGQLSVEAPTTGPKLTLYTCTLQGQADGRIVVEARTSS